MPSRRFGLDCENKASAYPVSGHAAGVMSGEALHIQHQPVTNQLHQPNTPIPHYRINQQDAQKKRAGVQKKRAGAQKKRAGAQKKRAGAQKKVAGAQKKVAGAQKKVAGA